MANVLMNEYRVTRRDQSEVLAVRMDTIGVAKDFEDDLNPIVQIQRTRTDLNVFIPENVPPVFFQTQVEPQAAVDAHCMATPTTHTVESGTTVVFEAIEGAGFTFVGWFLDAPIVPEDTGFDPTVPISTDKITEIVMTAPAPGQTRTVFARFAP